jgi:legumain
VYDGVRIDYRGADVTAENFLSVLLGDAAAMAGKGSGRVVDSGPHDKVGGWLLTHGDWGGPC